jgi:hypothetical protein
MFECACVCVCGCVCVSVSVSVSVCVSMCIICVPHGAHMHVHLNCMMHCLVHDIADIRTRISGHSDRRHACAPQLSAAVGRSGLRTRKFGHKFASCTELASHRDMHAKHSGHGTAAKG